MYIHVLGYDVDFGHAEVLALVRSNKYSEKHVGYTALSLLLRGDDPLINSIVSTVRIDLTTPVAPGKNSSSASDAAQSLALCSIANISGLELIQALHVEVQHILVSKTSTPNVKKKAALCLLRLVRTSPNLSLGGNSLRMWPVASGSAPWCSHEHHESSERTCVAAHGGVRESHPVRCSHIGHACLEESVCSRVSLLPHTESMATDQASQVLAALSQCNCSRLDNGNARAESAAPSKAYISQLTSVVSKILTETDVSDSINKSNADHAILFEAVNLIVTWGSAGPLQLREGAMKLLGKFISVREPNIRYLGLMTMAKLAQLEGSAEGIKKHQATVLVSLKDADISVRRRALDLLFVMCDTDNAERIVDELVAHLVLADAAIREEMVLKIAILAEKYATDLRWYVDTILKLISISGDHVSDAIWHRVVQIVTNHPQGDLQAYTAATLFVAASPRRCHETAVRVAAYVLGEFGFLIAERPGMSGEEQFRILHQHWATSDPQTRAILISTYAKLANLYEECRPLVAPVFARCKNSVDVEIQQRSTEYASMREAFSPEAVEDLLREMPPFEDRRQSALEQRLREKEGDDSAAVVKAARPSAAQRQRAAQSAAAARAAEEAADAAEWNGPCRGRSDAGTLFSNLDLWQCTRLFFHSLRLCSIRFLVSPQDAGLENGGAGAVVGIPKDVIPAMRKAFPTFAHHRRVFSSRTLCCRSASNMNT